MLVFHTLLYLFFSSFFLFLGLQIDKGMLKSTSFACCLFWFGLFLMLITGMKAIGGEG